MTDQPDPQQQPGEDAALVRAVHLSGTEHLQEQRDHVNLMRATLREDAAKTDRTSVRISCGIAATMAKTAHRLAVAHLLAHQETCTDGPACAAQIDRLCYPLPMTGVEAIAAILDGLATDGFVRAEDAAVRDLIAVLAQETHS